MLLYLSPDFCSFLPFLPWKSGNWVLNAHQILGNISEQNKICALLSLYFSQKEQIISQEINNIILEETTWYEKEKTKQEQDNRRWLELGEWNCQAVFEQKPQLIVQGSIPKEHQNGKPRLSQEWYWVMSLTRWCLSFVLWQGIQLF